ncbi:hypothetical protein [Fischerella sp. JS2]|uniref:hypothetical protein n=1 Tax=Fischerella sp. JS2 TaxID=2597771 RepID=UPI0028EC2092|nr:hypothetical protein [Fischerella sp. JS2]
MTQVKIFELARQGDVQALTSLMNSQLQLKNVIAKVSIKNGYLRVRLESNQIPDKQNLVKYVRQEIIGLKSESIKKVKVDGFQQGKSFPCWSQVLNLELQQKCTAASLGKQPKSKVLIKTKKFDNVSINKYILKPTLSLFQKELKPKFIFIPLVFISIYLIGENYLFKKQGCIAQSNLQSKNINYCK